MKRQKPKAIKTRAGGTMTEAEYLAWIRSSLRSRSLRWPPRAKALEMARKPFQGGGRQKWVYLCALCEVWYKGSEVVVDHFPHACGSILSVEDISNFAERLFCETDNLRVLCKPCHDIHTYAESHKLSFDDAKTVKEIIQVLKQSAKSVTEFCMRHGYMLPQLKNSTMREVAVREIYCNKLKGRL